MLLERATRTIHHSRVDGLPSKCETKNNLSDEWIMLVTSALIRGIGCGIALATLAGGGPVYITGSSLIASKEKYCNCLALFFQGNGLNSLVSSDNVGKGKSQKSG